MRQAQGVRWNCLRGVAFVHALARRATVKGCEAFDKICRRAELTCDMNRCQLDDTFVLFFVGLVQPCKKEQKDKGPDIEHACRVGCDFYHTVSSRRSRGHKVSNVPEN